MPRFILLSANVRHRKKDSRRPHLLTVPCSFQCLCSLPPSLENLTGRRNRESFIRRKDHAVGPRRRELGRRPTASRKTARRDANNFVPGIVSAGRPSDVADNSLATVINILARVFLSTPRGQRPSRFPVSCRRRKLNERAWPAGESRAGRGKKPRKEASCGSRGCARTKYPNER